MAIDQKYIDLINAEIDGEISAEDRALLDDYVAGNAEAAALRRKAAEAVVRTLKTLEDRVEREPTPSSGFVSPKRGKPRFGLFSFRD